MHIGLYSRLETEKQGKHLWVVLRDWTTPFGVVPEGASSDGASIHRLLWFFSDPGGELFQAAVLHDYLYDNAIGTKRYADLAFYKTALAYGTTPWKARVAYWFVKKFGKGKYV